MRAGLKESGLIRVLIRLPVLHSEICLLIAAC